MAKRNSPGCTCCGGSGSIVVYGCNGAILANYPYQIETTGGSVVASGSTSSTGSVSFSESGSFVFVAEGFANFDFTSPYSGAMNLTVGSGYVCCTMCAIPFPDTLHMTDGLGNAVTLTWQSANNYWYGCETISATIFSDSYCDTTTGTIGVEYRLTCLSASGGTAQLEQSFLVEVCGSGGASAFYPSSCPLPFDDLNPKSYAVCATDGNYTCSPLSITFVFSNPQVVCGGGVTVIVPIPGTHTITS